MFRNFVRDFDWSVWLTLGIFVLATQTGWGQDVVLPGMAARLQTVTAWIPNNDLTSSTMELTPTDIVALPDGRLLLATLGGTIRVVSGRTLLDDPLLSHEQVGLDLQLESGMTGIAIHPNFASQDASAFGRGKLYTITTENSFGRGGTAGEAVDFPFDGEVHQDVVREWDISPIINDTSINSLPELNVSHSRELMRVAQPGPYHNLVDLMFDDVGDLYITSGDGGNSADNASTTQSRKQTSQDMSTIYGNVLRINPDPAAHALVRASALTGEPAYSIPPTNPFASDDVVETRGADTLAEIFAWGLRSPFRIGRDSLEGTILVSDVGEARREEISVIELGGNYGWGRFEGTREDNDFVTLYPAAEHSPPLFEYGRDDGRSAIGGTVYRGTSFPQLYGKYVFADFGQATPTARLFYGGVDPEGDDYGKIYEFNLDSSEALFPVSTDGDSIPDTMAPLPDRIFSIAEDQNGELLILGGPDPRAGVPTADGAYLIRLGTDLRCDVIPDRECNVEDLDALTFGLQQPSPSLRLDIDWDGVPDNQDIDAWLDQVGDRNGQSYKRGDTDLDGRVDFADFLRLSAAFGMPDTGWTEGNFNGDPLGTDFADFLTLSANFDQATVVSIPEPRSGWQLVWLMICWIVTSTVPPRHDCDRRAARTSFRKSQHG